SWTPISSGGWKSFSLRDGTPVSSRRGSGGRFRQPPPRSLASGEERIAHVQFLHLGDEALALAFIEVRSLEIFALTVPLSQASASIDQHFRHPIALGGGEVAALERLLEGVDAIVVEAPAGFRLARTGRLEVLTETGDLVARSEAQPEVEVLAGGQILVERRVPSEAAPAQDCSG